VDGARVRAGRRERSGQDPREGGERWRDVEKRRRAERREGETRDWIREGQERDGEARNGEQKRRREEDWKGRRECAAPEGTLPFQSRGALWRKKSQPSQRRGEGAGSSPSQRRGDGGHERKSKAEEGAEKDGLAGGEDN